jgi:hypothetical protein
VTVSSLVLNPTLVRPDLSWTVVNEVLELSIALGGAAALAQRSDNAINAGFAAGSPGGSDKQTPLGRNVCMQAGILVQSATEHFECLRLLRVSSRVVFPRAGYTLLRGSLEAAVFSWWITTATDASERHRRGLAVHRDDLREEATFLRAVPRGRSQRPVSPDERIDKFRKLIGATNDPAIAWNKLKTDLPQAVAKLPWRADAGEYRNLEALWRLLSCLTHGRLWAYLPMSDYERPTQPDVINAIKVEPNLPTLSAAARTVSHVCANAVDSYEKYCGVI